MTAASAFAGAATFTPLGDLAGGVFLSFAGGLSADGQVVVGSSDDTVGFEAFRWTASSGLTPLGILSGGFSSAYGVSGDGLVVVGESGQQGFRWTSSTGITTLGLDTVYGLSASFDGAVIVGVRITGTGDLEAFRTSGSTNIGLGDLPGGVFNSGANDVTPDGSVIVGNATSASGVEAFRWESGVMTGLGDLPGGPFSSTAYAVSADGSIVVGSGRIAGGTEQAFRWTAATGMQPLAFLPGGSIHAANVITADGSLIMGSGLFNNRFVGVVWDSSLTPQTLESFMTARGVAIPANFDVGFPNGVALNAGVVTVCGSGVNAQGNQEAWVASFDLVIPCIGDLDGDRQVNEPDLGVLLGNWRSGPGGDLNGDGQTSEPDLGILLANWLNVCP